MAPLPQMQSPVLEFPEKLQFLFQPARYKVAYGGRGGAKSWGFARALLIMGTQRPLRVLCARELQKSIQDSVHKILKDQIEAMGMQAFYEVQQATIIGRGPALGTEFNFEGIRNNIGKIKSYEGIDVCWVEEADGVTKSSWEVLIPTIRKPGSEIWVGFNPNLEKDYTYQYFVVRPPKSAVVVNINWQDNPWFPQTLREEMEECKSRSMDDYLHVWEGKCRQSLEGAIYKEELREAELQNRICKVPYDRTTSVDVIFDLGYADHTAMWFVQRVAMETRFIDFYQDRFKLIEHYLLLMQNRGYTYGTIWLPHDARAKRLGTKLSIEEIVRAKGYRVRIVPSLSVTDGINAARTVFPNCYFDQDKCQEGVQSLKHYRYELDPNTKQFSKQPLHDEYSDAADAFRYAAIAVRAPSAIGSRVMQGLRSAGAQGLGGTEFDLENGEVVQAPTWLSDFKTALQPKNRGPLGWMKR